MADLEKSAKALRDEYDLKYGADAYLQLSLAYVKLGTDFVKACRTTSRGYTRGQVGKVIAMRPATDHQAIEDDGA